MNWVYQILIGLGFILVGYGIYLVVSAQSLSDEERESLGLGPKGQGR